MSFVPKTWHNKGDTVKTPLNADAMNDLENRIKDAFNSAISESKLEDDGYIKFENGIMIQWVTKTINANSLQQWSHPGLYVQIFEAGLWPVNFKYIIESFYTPYTSQGWINHGISSTSMYGGFYYVSPAQTAQNVKMRITGFGTWK